MIKDKNTKLNENQERFSQLYAKNIDKYEAYEQAGYKLSKRKCGNCASIQSLLNNVYVLKRIEFWKKEFDKQNKL